MRVVNFSLEWFREISCSRHAPQVLVDLLQTLGTLWTQRLPALKTLERTASCVSSYGSRGYLSGSALLACLWCLHIMYHILAPGLSHRIFRIKPTHTQERQSQSGTRTTVRIRRHDHDDRADPNMRRTHDELELFQRTNLWACDGAPGWCAGFPQFYPAQAGTQEEIP